MDLLISIIIIIIIIIRIIIITFIITIVILASVLHQCLHTTHPHLDSNECSQEKNPCGIGNCVNTKGSYFCDCKFGFYFDQKLGTCKGKVVIYIFSSEIFLLLVIWHNLRPYFRTATFGKHAEFYTIKGHLAVNFFSIPKMCS